MKEIRVSNNLHFFINDTLEKYGELDEVALQEIKNKITEDNIINSEEKSLLDNLANKNNIKIKSGSAVSNLNFAEMNFDKFNSNKFFDSFVIENLPKFSKSLSENDCKMIAEFLKNKNNDEKNDYLKKLFAHPNLKEDFEHFKPNYATQKIMFKTFVESKDDNLSAIALKFSGNFIKPPPDYDALGMSSGVDFMGISYDSSLHEETNKMIVNKNKVLREFYGSNIGLAKGNINEIKKESSFFKKIISDKLINSSETFSTDFIRKNPETFSSKDLENLFYSLISNNDKESINDSIKIMKNILLKIDGSEKSEKNAYALGNYLGALGKAVERLPDNFDIKKILIETISLIPVIGDSISKKFQLKGKINEGTKKIIDSSLEEGSDKLKKTISDKNKDSERAFRDYSKLTVKELMSELHQHLRKIDALSQDENKLEINLENAFNTGMSIFQTKSFM